MDGLINTVRALPNTLRVRLVGVVLIIHAALVPLLYLGVSAIVEEGYAELFVNSVRSFSRLTADELEAVPDRDFEQRAAALLDGVMLTGQVVFTEITDGSRKLHNSIAPDAPGQQRSDDFYFGDHGDQVYYISHAVKRGGRPVMLRLGFDEGPTLERIAAAKHRVLTAVLSFTLASIVVSIWLSAVIAHPMVRLQEAAKRVAGGDVHTQLQMSSSIREVQDLNHHLESMRLALVGANERLENEILEREVSERKRLDLERKLLHRERIATIGTLAGGVAHEFNNILTPILLYSQLALNATPADSPRARDLGRIVAAAHRARSLITRILTFSREMDSQGVKTFSLRPTVEEALALLRAIVPANIEIMLDSQVEDMWVTGDPSLVHQVVINLGTNAYQAMRRTGGRLAMRLWQLQESPEGPAGPGRFALLEVSDTGHGITPSAIAHVFEPFFTTREIGEGTGLGLSVVHGIVTSMGGAITAESVVDRGTTFRVYFPATEAPVHRSVSVVGS
jgi:signal transduction histidine kinase